MIEALKAKAVELMLQKIGERVESDGESITGLLKFDRLDSKLGKVYTDFVGVTLYIPEVDLPRLGKTVIARGVTYDVVQHHAKSEYNGFARVELTERTTTYSTEPVAGEWR